MRGGIAPKVPFKEPELSFTTVISLVSATAPSSSWWCWKICLSERVKEQIDEKFARWFAFYFQDGAAGTGKATMVRVGWTSWQVAGWVTQGCATTACHPLTLWKRRTCACFHNCRGMVKRLCMASSCGQAARTKASPPQPVQGKASKGRVAPLCLWGERNGRSGKR